jgi:hypothetical protein
VTSRWWFWTGIGGAVAGGVVAALLIGSKGGGANCPAMYTCPR